MTVDSDHAGARLAKLSYLTTGLSWKADYVALFDEKAGKLDLQGWITLTNQSGTPFVDADTKLVAGKVQVGGGGGDAYYNADRGRAPRRDREQHRPRPGAGRLLHLLAARADHDPPRTRPSRSASSTPRASPRTRSISGTPTR